MGVIINQSVKNMATTYAGFGLGALNTLFLYTYFLDQQYYGLVSFLLSAANLMWPFMAFGVHSTIVKFFSSYKTKEEKDKLLNLALILPLAISLILGLIGHFTYEFLLDYFSDGNELVKPYVWLIYLLAIATAYFEIFFAWAKIYYKSVFGNFMKEVVHRLGTTILLFLVYFEVLEADNFMYGVGVVFLFRLVVMGAYAFKLHRPSLKFSFPSNLSRVLKYTALILIAASVATALLDLDKVMIESYLPIENVAIYGIGIYIATVISVPQKAMHQITNPITAEYLNTRNFEKLEDLYKKSSINLSIVSALIFILIITNVHTLYELIPEEYSLSILIVLLISLVKLYDNILAINNSILFNSDYYRLVLAIGVLLVILAFLLNLFFIPRFGIEGAAMATFIAFFIYNTSKIILVQKKFKMNPFTKQSFLLFALIILFAIAFYFWEFPFHPILNIALKGSITSVLYISAIYFFKFSEEINAMLKSILAKFR
ncbi:polysaccharide biosynthesis C-terminal domain-containing protein [Zunongwangia sp. SCSIO 43204]|uniref:oligosaccharide flippase family protein n=1 Tax=Zunongwangia sp. SCSIO 43204 TaxID=2779359 RepID=UPI001CA835CE|nr:polysaccharide biosynthesis C-terminal domain-containing protein [Zunongwangia sp. SCSIO 43204]UAB82993.1 polysaccharide biosynthesis C-terminal domain-containing protein [Zunongwangia sp. SCSIO 43204]